MFHTSPNKITEINNLGIAGDCLFFSDNVYVMTEAESVYVYEADFDCIRVWQLHDEEIIEEIADNFGCSIETAEGLLDGSECEWEQESCDADMSWWLQGKRGECAKKMGFDGCEDEDEQGTVYIIPMSGRENELNLI